MKKLFGVLQKIGKSLMLPIAALPVAALMLRLGSEDIFNIPFVHDAGNAIFTNLPLIFAIGVAIGILFDSAGAAALSGAVGYLTMTAAYTAINPDINMGVLSGIISGYLAGILYNRFYNIKVPQILGFFGGKRFVPIITGLVCLILAAIFGYVWPPVQAGISAFGNWLTQAGAGGAGVYGVCNVLLLPFGLHHVINSLVWFIFGDFTNAAGQLVSGDLYRFFAGDPTAGTFMAGAYPIFMFGMPGAALAMYRAAKKENRAKVGGVLFSAALVFALTGIGEPLLFSFCFVAPGLYAVHALLQGSSYAVCAALGIKHGFGFSAGLIDYVLNYGLSTKGWMIIPLGVVYFILYYFIFLILIKKFNFQTPGREGFDSDGAVALMDIPEDQKVGKYIEYLGGGSNFTGVEACITRLRLTVKDESLVNDAGLKSLGAAGVLRVRNNIQVVVGTQAEMIAEAINNEIKRAKQK